MQNLSKGTAEEKMHPVVKVNSYVLDDSRCTFFQSNPKWLDSANLLF
jgi:hypothetical protein